MLCRTLFSILVVFLTLTSCQSGGGTKSVSAHLELKYAKNISDDDLALLGKEYNRIAVDASVYKGLMDMLGVGERCIDFSDQMKLDVEKVIAAKPDLLLMSAYEGSDVEKFRKTGISVVECTDFLETSPLARAEWMRYFGRLWGVGDKADSLFSVVEKGYKGLCDESQSTGRKRVFFDLLYGNIWYQPSLQSTTGTMVKDAGGELTFPDTPLSVGEGAGVRPLSSEQVLIQAKDADFWFIRAYGNQQLTLLSLAKLNPVYSQFKAFNEGNVFVCYTDKTRYFEETPFRPDWLLKDFKAILAPPTPQGGVKLRYFKKIQ